MTVEATGMKHIVKALGAALLGLLLGRALPAAAAVLNVHDYATPQAALAAAHDGDRVYFPAGVYLVPDSGLVVDKQIELFGDGVGRGESGTVLRPQSLSGDGNVIVIRSRGTEPASYVTIHDLRIDRHGPPGSPSEGRGYGILLKQGPASRGTVERLILERIVVAAMAADGIRIEGGKLGADAVILSTLTDVQCVSCRGNGLVLRNGVIISVERGYFNANRLAGLFADAVAALRLDKVAFENNQNRPQVDAPQYDTQLRLKLCHGFNVLGCYFENYAGTAPGARSTAIVLEDCHGGLLQGCFFSQSTYVPGSRGVLAMGGSTAITFGTNTYDMVGTTLQLEDTESAQSHVVFPQCALRPVASDSTAYALRVGRRSPGTVFMLPRVSATDSTQRYFDGARWRSVTPGR
jgi:hypothetical protein